MTTYALIYVDAAGDVQSEHVRDVQDARGRRGELKAVGSRNFELVERQAGSSGEDVPVPFDEG